MIIASLVNLSLAVKKYRLVVSDFLPSLILTERLYIALPSSSLLPVFEAIIVIDVVLSPELIFEVADFHSRESLTRLFPPFNLSTSLFL